MSSSYVAKILLVCVFHFSIPIVLFIVLEQDIIQNWTPDKAATAHEAVVAEIATSATVCNCGWYIINTLSWLTGMHLWRSEYSSFARHAQMKFCRHLIVVPLSTFHRLAEVIGDPKGELIFLFHTARCGSTLLTEVHHSISLYFI